MPQQLFLFDDAKKRDDEQPSGTAADGNSLLPNEEAEKPEELADTNLTDFAVTEQKEDTKTVADPFAEVQQQQQDKIDTMLLLPTKKRGRKSFTDMDKESILIEVPEDDVLFQKQYYATRVVAEWFGISLSQLRQWETEFDILQPKKNGKGDRHFRPEDVKNLKLIYHLIRVRKFTVQGAKQYMKENKKKLQTTMQLTESLNKLKQFLLELKAISG